MTVAVTAGMMKYGSIKTRDMRAVGWLALAISALACGGGDTSGEASPDAAPTSDGDAIDSLVRCRVVAGAPAERVATTSGTVHGAMDGATWAYKAVPFAAPPVGNLRFAAPQPAACATAELDATAFGPQCPQLDDTGAYIGVEDCLQLNVWSPASSPASSSEDAQPPARPVMVWIHGGGNSVGTATDPLYDGRQLAEHGDVVIVSVNYRLGQLGFLAHASLDAASGNYGTLDLVQALTWVKSNIAGFGGDPGNVTIFGESAGARDVCTLLATQPAAGLFHRAIMESGACKFLPTRSTAEAQGTKVVAAVGCTTATDVPACLRALPAQTLIDALPGDPSALGSSPYQSTIDGTVLVEQPADAMAAGRHHAVPIIVGANADETNAVAPPRMTEDQYAAAIHTQYGTTLGDRVLAQYPSSRFGNSPRAAYVRVTTDSRFVCPARETARAADAGQTQPVYRYFFQYAQTSPLGAVHGLDVPFVFGSFGALAGANGQPYVPTTGDLAVSAAIQAAWTTFAHTGNPITTPAWPSWNPTDPTLQIDTSMSVVAGIRTDDCDFWQPIYNAL